MTALLTLDEVVAYNIKELRESRGWTPTELAETLTAVLERPYTRFTVYDLEGRRKREIRWTELAALCSIFGVSLWRLVLPKEGDEVNTRIATGDVTGVDLTDLPSDDPDLAAIGATKGVVWHAYPSRDDLAWRLFGMNSYTLEAEATQFLRTIQEKGLRMDDVRAIAEVLLPQLRRGLGRTPPNKTDEEEGH